MMHYPYFIEIFGFKVELTLHDINFPQPMRPHEWIKLPFLSNILLFSFYIYCFILFYFFILLFILYYTFLILTNLSFFPYFILLLCFMLLFYFQPSFLLSCFVPSFLVLVFSFFFSCFGFFLISFLFSNFIVVNHYLLMHPNWPIILIILIKIKFINGK